MSMQTNEVYEAIDNLRAGHPVDALILDRLCNYMDANVTEFIVTYQEAEEDLQEMYEDTGE